MTGNAFRIMLIYMGLIFAGIASWPAHAEPTERLPITPAACNYVETLAQSSVVLQQSLGDDQAGMWLDGELERSTDDADLYLATYMVRSAIPTTMAKYNSREVTELGKLLPKYNRLELFGVKMKQLCASNENALYEVPKR
ncbi:hypothetical protein [Pseudomonas phage D6]|nr:hypothetical protein [Pseudomonas phage D6]